MNQFHSEVIKSTNFQLDFTTGSISIELLNIIVGQHHYWSCPYIGLVIFLMFSCGLLFYQHNLSLDLVHVNLLCKTMMHDFDVSIDDFYHCIFENK